MFSAIVSQFPSTIPLALSHCKYKPLILSPDFYMLLLISLQKLVTLFVCQQHNNWYIIQFK